jgi:hypothetical protein
MEDYFELLEHKKPIDFCRFRTTNHMPPTEQGRWDNMDNSDIGDEYQYSLQCQYFKGESSINECQVCSNLSFTVFIKQFGI